MRLLDTSSVHLHEFHGETIPAYAILSHTWGEDEVTFQALQKRNRPPYRAMILRGGVYEEVIIEELLGQSDEEGLGWQKIKNCCALAASRGYKYVWIDTCCINKESSAELTESINSMFVWYRNADICFAYLGDVPSNLADPEAAGSAFRESRWFTRAWTLQELLAPRNLEFFSADWAFVGTREKGSRVLAQITSISRILGLWQDACIAEKMSWASRRKCLRVEDHAYSLLGLFGIGMPLLYGEGTRAFYRLQLEILKESTDESIFAWTNHTASVGLLASSPRDFAESRDIRLHTFVFSRPHYSMTNMGLQIEASLIDSRQLSVFKVMPLNCQMWKKEMLGPGKLPVPFPLVLMPKNERPDLFVRTRAQLELVQESRWEEIWHAHIAAAGSGKQDAATVVKRQTIYISNAPA